MKRLTKRQLALSLASAGRSCEEIARALEISVEQAQLMTGINRQTEAFQDAAYQNGYARMFSGVLRFKTVEAARDSIALIDALFHQFEDEHDIRGQHQAQLMALIGKNRAESVQNFPAARVFAEWLSEHLFIQPICENIVSLMETFYEDQ